MNKNSSCSLWRSHNSLLVVIAMVFVNTISIWQGFVLQKCWDTCVLSHPWAQSLPMFGWEGHNSSDAFNLPSHPAPQPHWFHALIPGSGSFNHLTERWVIKHPVDFNSILQDIVFSYPSSPHPILQINTRLSLGGGGEEDRNLSHLYLSHSRRFGLQKKNTAIPVSPHLPLLLPARPLPGACFCQKILFLPVSNPAHKLPTGT